MRRAIEEGFYVIYVDETAFTRNEGKVYGFAPKGKRLEFIHHKPAYSIGGIGAISRYGLEAFQLRDGKTNKYAFIHFILCLVKKLKDEQLDDFNKVLLYLDNATYHTCPDTLELFKLLNVNYIFAPAYLSPLNPIEYFFGTLKAHLRHHDLVTK